MVLDSTKRTKEKNGETFAKFPSEALKAESPTLVAKGSSENDQKKPKDDRDALLLSTSERDAPPLPTAEPPSPAKTQMTDGTFKYVLGMFGSKKKRETNKETRIVLTSVDNDTIETTLSKVDVSGSNSAKSFEKNLKLSTSYADEKNVGAGEDLEDPLEQTFTNVFGSFITPRNQKQSKLFSPKNKDRPIENPPILEPFLAEAKSFPLAGDESKIGVAERTETCSDELPKEDKQTKKDVLDEGKREQPSDGETTKDTAPQKVIEYVMEKVESYTQCGSQKNIEEKSSEEDQIIKEIADNVMEKVESYTQCGSQKNIEDKSEEDQILIEIADAPVDPAKEAAASKKKLKLQKFEKIDPNIPKTIVAAQKEKGDPDIPKTIVAKVYDESRPSRTRSKSPRKGGRSTSPVKMIEVRKNARSSSPRRRSKSPVKLIKEREKARSRSPTKRRIDNGVVEQSEEIHIPDGLAQTLDIFENNEIKELLTSLCSNKLGQSHLFDKWGKSDKISPAALRQMGNQLHALDKSYPGGLRSYILKAKTVM